MRTITASFETRRDAEMAVEHLTQKYGVDRRTIVVVAESDRNSVGSRPAGGDVEGGHVKKDNAGAPPLEGRLVVEAEVEEALADKICSTFITFGDSNSSR